MNSEFEGCSTMFCRRLPVGCRFALIIASICLLPGLSRGQSPTPRLIALDQAASLDEAVSLGSGVSDLRYISDEYGNGSERKTLLIWNSTAEQQGGPPGWDEPLASDRPDFTEASCTVGRGVCQVEMGYTYFHDSNAASSLNAHSFPEMLVRLGVLADWLELRLAWNYGHEILRAGGVRTSNSGSEDLYLGLKLGLTPQQGILPEMALVPQMTVPLGSVFSAGQVLPGVNWLYGWEINDFLSTAGSTQVNLSIDPGSGREYTEFAQSWTIGYSLAENIGAYTEWFVLAPAGADTARTEHYLDAGLTYNFSNNLQFDVRVGKGVSAAAIDLFAGTGLVARF